MSDVAHPNLFPQASAGIDLVDTPAPAEPSTPAAETPRPVNAWANPVAFKRAEPQPAVETNDGKNETSAPKREAHARKRETKTRAEQAIDYLRLKGPLTSKALCESMSLDAEVGISPYIVQALKNGSILRDRGHYFLPGQEASLPAPKDASQPKTAKKASAQPAASSEPAASVKPVDADVKRDPRVADFTLGVGDAVLTHWLDGSVTLQRGASVLELAHEQTRMLTMFVDLCK